MKLNTHLLITPRPKNDRSYNSNPPIGQPSWFGAQLKHRDTAFYIYFNLAANLGLRLENKLQRNQ
jgi:hypothetical protein